MGCAGYGDWRCCAAPSCLLNRVLQLLGAHGRRLLQQRVDLLLAVPQKRSHPAALAASATGRVGGYACRRHHGLGLCCLYCPTGKTRRYLLQMFSLLQTHLQKNLFKKLVNVDHNCTRTQNQYCKLYKPNATQSNAQQKRMLNQTTKIAIQVGPGLGCAASALLA